MTTKNNVIQFTPAVKPVETFEEFLDKFITDLGGRDLPPDEEIEKDALMAIAEGDLKKARYLTEIISRRNTVGIRLVK